MAEFPIAEIPTGGGPQGGGHIFQRPGIHELPRFEEELKIHRPGIAELPVASEFGSLAREVFTLRQRVYALESAQLFAGFGYRPGGGWPNELPAELGEGGGGGGGRPRPGEIAELPQRPILEQIAAFESRLVVLEQNVLASLKSLTEKVDGLREQ